VDSHITGINERLALVEQKVEVNGKELAEIKLMLEKLLAKSGSDDKSSTSTTVATEGLLISGGYKAKKSVELFVPATGKSCSLPDLPDERWEHTMNGLNICGSKDVYDSPCLNRTSGGSWVIPVANCRSPSTGCVHFSSGQWQYSPYTFVEPRAGHMSWQTEEGLMLLSGSYSYFTTEIIPTEETHETKGLSFKLETGKSDACAITGNGYRKDQLKDGFELDSSVILTGGGGYIDNMRVERYDNGGIYGGLIETLPNLSEPRDRHACGSYLRLDGTQVLLVTGGQNKDLRTISSTEVLVRTASAWTASTPLPFAAYGLRATTMNNILYLSGGYRREPPRAKKDFKEVRDEILAWNDETKKWNEKGKVIPRWNHAITTIKLSDVMQHCR